jgi:hypothetical protein
MVSPFRGSEVLCFGACDPRAANKHTGHPHSRGGGARTSHLTPGYAPCRLTACDTKASARGNADYKGTGVIIKN